MQHYQGEISATDPRRSTRIKEAVQHPAEVHEDEPAAPAKRPKRNPVKPKKTAAKAQEPAQEPKVAEPAAPAKKPVKKQPNRKNAAKQPEPKQTNRKLRPEEHCTYRDSAYVHEDYHCLLNQTNISQNNNKFYIIQLLHFEQTSYSESEFALWTRWGRVGEPGQSDLRQFSGEQAAIEAFKKKFNDKTRNHWGQLPFQHYPGKYDMLERDLNGLIADDDEDDEANVDNDGDNVTNENQTIVSKIKSKLDQRLQSLIKLIFNQKMMAETMQSIGYDTNKMPLGKMTKVHIQRGYDVLKQIADVLDSPTFQSRSNLEQLSSRFYTIIPHAFGRQRPPVINTPQELKRKLQMVESLGDIEIATSIMKRAEAMAETNIHPLDMYYSKLNNSLSPIDRSSEHWSLIEEYVAKTHASTHSHYGLKVLDIFETDRTDEQPYHISPTSAKDDSGHWLLWHGSRLTNFVGILSQGLRIAPPEAPSTGYMFGKGIYFADMVSKSANYCFASKSSSVGLLLLCQVYLGRQVDLYHADYNADKVVDAKNGHSTKGCGSTCPDPEEVKHVHIDGFAVKVPAGKATTAQLKDKGSLFYNEFIVYKPEQVKMRYVVQVKFDFK